MKINHPLLRGRILKRYKRFLADVRLDDGRELTVHCANSGSMRGCWAPGWPCVISDSENPKRKLRHTLEMTHNGSCWIGVNTQHPNPLAEEAIRAGLIEPLRGYPEIHRERKYGGNSRIDLLLQNETERVYVEVKSVTLVEKGYYAFPDAVTTRGLKHLRELAAVKQAGHRAVMLFIIQRSDGRCFTPAGHIDPDYATMLREAENHGVEILCYRAGVYPGEIRIEERVDYCYQPAETLAGD